MWQPSLAAALAACAFSNAAICCKALPSGGHFIQMRANCGVKAVEVGRSVHTTGRQFQSPM